MDVSSLPVDVDDVLEVEPVAVLLVDTEVELVAVDVVLVVCGFTDVLIAWVAVLVPLPVLDVVVVVEAVELTVEVAPVDDCEALVLVSVEFDGPGVVSLEQAHNEKKTAARSTVRGRTGKKISVTIWKSARTRGSVTETLRSLEFPGRLETCAERTVSNAAYQDSVGDCDFALAIGSGVFAAACPTAWRNYFL